MDRRIRQVAALITMLLVAVAASSGYVQGLASESIASRTGSNPDEVAINRFRVFQECRWERGAILSIDGVELARSKLLPEGRRCHYEREYPTGDLTPHVVGQWSLHFGRTGLEAAYDTDLVGEPEAPRSLVDYFRRRPRVGNTVVSTIDTRLQQAALEALGDRRGGVVALAPKTGAVLVAASNPSYDPNPLAANDRAVAERARCELGVGLRQTDDGGTEPCENLASPMVSVALQSRRPPGSTYKVVTAAAALESGNYSPTSPSFPVTRSYLAPGDQRSISNYGGGSCGGNLTQALTNSCNTTFARIAVDVGADQLLVTSQAMGLDQFGGEAFVGCSDDPISDIGQTRTGCMPSEHRQPATADDDGTLRCPAGGHLDRSAGECVQQLTTAAFRARAGFGQWVLQVSPFGMAVVAATVANGGFSPRPRFADRVIDSSGRTVKEIRTGVGTAAMSSGSAQQLSTMMLRVVTSGTARGAFAGFGVPTAGKTGTGQQGPFCSRQEAELFGYVEPAADLSPEDLRVRLNRCGRLPHAWFIAFAPVENPTIAVAVLVERGGGNNEVATGGRVAAPVARKVLEAFFSLYPAAAGGASG